MTNFPPSPVYNASAFEGTVESDFLNLGRIDDIAKKNLIDYSVADFDDYKEALINYLKAVSLDDYNNFVESDFGMMFIELFAYIGATNSLKADFLANELYFPTVKTRQKLSGMLQLIGVKMKGPTSSKATAKVTPESLTFTTGDTLTIEKDNRTIRLASSRDGRPLSYTLYKTNLSTGKIDQITNSAEDLVLDDTYLSSDETYFEGLVLLEGVYRSKEGTFSNQSTIQTISLTEPSIIEGSIFVSASDGNYYSEINNLALASSNTHSVFEKKYNDDYSCTLFFGDGIRGRKPQPSVAYKAFYRTGGGDRGDVVSNKIQQSAPALKNSVDALQVTISNTTKATGGQNSESVEHAKKYAPYFFRTQYRAVTGEDYNALANSFTSTTGAMAKAVPVLRQNGAAGNMIDIYVLAKASDTQVERASLPFKSELLEYMNQYRMITDELTIVDGVVRTLDLVCKVFVDKSRRSDVENIKTKVSDRLLKYFSVDTREFGESLILSDLTNDILSLADTRFFKLENISSDIFVNFNELIQLNNFEINIELV